MSSRLECSKKCNLQDGNLVGVNLRGAKLEQDLRLEGVSLYKADVRYSTMEEVMFTRRNMVGAKLQRSELQGATFDQCAMMTVQLKASNMRRARLKDSILIGASFDNAVLSDAVIVGGVWMNTQVSGTDVKDALFVEPAGLDPKEARSLKTRGAMFVTREQYAAMNKDPV